MKVLECGRKQVWNRGVNSRKADDQQSGRRGDEMKTLGGQTEEIKEWVDVEDGRMAKKGWAAMSRTDKKTIWRMGMDNAEGPLDIAWNKK